MPLPLQYYEFLKKYPKNASGGGFFNGFFWAWRIRDISRRIRILRSAHWITDPDPALFVSGQQNKNFLLSIFCLLLTVCTFTTVLKENTFLRSPESGSPQFLCLLIDPDPGGAKTYGSDPNTKNNWFFYLKNGGLLTWEKQRWGHTGPSSTCSPPWPRWCNPSRGIAAVSGHTPPRHLNNSHGLTLICLASNKVLIGWVNIPMWPCYHWVERSRKRVE